MPFIRITEEWPLQVKELHRFVLDVREGVFEDSLALYVDDTLIVTGKAALWHLKDYRLFDVDGRTLELRWVWSFWSGNPKSIVLMHKGRILAQYGSDRAAEDDVLE